MNLQFLKTQDGVDDHAKDPNVLNDQPLLFLETYENP
jgi:hypothetical protein